MEGHFRVTTLGATLLDGRTLPLGMILLLFISLYLIVVIVGTGEARETVGSKLVFTAVSHKRLVLKHYRENVSHKNHQNS